MGNVQLDFIIITVVPPGTPVAYENWYLAERDDTTWLASLPSIYQLIEVVNGEASDPEAYCAFWDTPTSKNTYYHPDGYYEMRSEKVLGRHGHQVIYGATGGAILLPPSSGSADKEAPFPMQLNWNRHVRADVVPFIHAAQLDGNPVEENWTTMSAPLMYYGIHLRQYFSCRPAVANEKPQLFPGECP